MNLGDIKTSNFLKKEDVGIGKLVTITQITQENVAKEGADPEVKVCLHFAELEKPMTVNSTNGQIIAQIAGSEEDIEHNWIGLKIVLYSDPNVTYKGKLVGGIRVRAPKAGVAVSPQQAKAKPQMVDDSSLPF